MISACDYESSRNAYSFHQHLTTYWQAMYDAAPELTVDMAPVAYGYKNNNLGWYGCSLEKGGSYTAPDCVSLYSVTQLAAAVMTARKSEYEAATDERLRLQAENERLQNENEELKNELSECSMVIDNIEPTTRAFEKMYSKLISERDELLTQLKYWFPKDAPFYGLVGSRDVAVAEHMKQWEITHTVIAKHEGEKHVNLP
jgi:hypothetical protein